VLCSRGRWCGAVQQGGGAVLCSRGGGAVLCSRGGGAVLCSREVVRCCAAGGGGAVLCSREVARCCAAGEVVRCCASRGGGAVLCSRGRWRGAVQGVLCPSDAVGPCGRQHLRGGDRSMLSQHSTHSTAQQGTQAMSCSRVLQELAGWCGWRVCLSVAVSDSMVRCLCVPDGCTVYFKQHMCIVKKRNGLLLCRSRMPCVTGCGRSRTL